MTETRRWRCDMCGGRWTTSDGITSLFHRCPPAAQIAHQRRLRAAVAKRRAERAARWHDEVAEAVDALYERRPPTLEESELAGRSDRTARGQGKVAT